MLYAVVETATNIVKRVIMVNPGAVADCRVVATLKTNWVPSPLTHVWTESGGVFTPVGPRTNGEVADHCGHFSTLLSELGYEGEIDAYQIETWLTAEISSVTVLDDLKPLLIKFLSALLHLSISVANGYPAESS